MKAGEPVDSANLEKAVRNAGAAVSSGDNVQITKIEFRNNTIAVDINGGPRGGHTSWRNRIQLSTGGISTGPAQIPTPRSRAPSHGRHAVSGLRPPRAGYDRRPTEELPGRGIRFLEAAFRCGHLCRNASSGNSRGDRQQKRAEVGMDHDQVLRTAGPKLLERAEKTTQKQNRIFRYSPKKKFFFFLTANKLIKLTNFRNFPATIFSPKKGRGIYIIRARTVASLRRSSTADIQS